MTGFGYLAKEGFKNVWNNRIMSIASVCVLISCLVLTGAAALFSMNVDNVVESVGKSNETSVYVKDGYSQLEAVYVGKAIEKLDNVESATFLSKEDAIKQYKSTLGDDLFAEMQGRNKLPDSFIVVMKDLSKYDDTVAQIKKIDGVDSISNHRELAKKLTDISNLVNMICVAVVCALTIISIFIIANTIRATMYSRRFEISIMKSVGATNSFVRWPFLIEGMIIGLISAIQQAQLQSSMRLHRLLFIRLFRLILSRLTMSSGLQAACLQLQVLLSASSAALFQSENTLKWKVTKYSVGNPDRNLKGGDYDEQIKKNFMCNALRMHDFNSNGNTDYCFC